MDSEKKLDDLLEIYTLIKEWTNRTKPNELNDADFLLAVRYLDESIYKLTAWKGSNDAVMRRDVIIVTKPEMANLAEGVILDDSNPDHLGDQ